MNRSTTIISTLITVAIAAGLFFYFRAKKADEYNTFHGYYTDARGLQQGAFITAHGVRIGKVTQVKITSDQHLRVKMAVQKTTVVPSGTIAVIASDGLTGDRSINFLLGSGKPLNDNTVLRTGLDTTFVESFNAKVTPLLRTGKLLLHTTDSTLQWVNSVFAAGLGDRAQREIRSIKSNGENLVRTSSNLNRDMQTVDATIARLNNSLANPAAKNADINKSITSADKSMQDANDKDLGQNMRELRNNINSLSGTFRKAGDNKMVKDKATYESARQQVASLDTSLKEYYKDPPPIQLIGGGSSKKK